jgi:hypothetical protein
MKQLIFLLHKSKNNKVFFHGHNYFISSHGHGFQMNKHEENNNEHKVDGEFV